MTWRHKCSKLGSKKVNCTLVQALRLCTGRTAHRGSRDIALLLHDHGTRRGWGVSVTPWPLFTPGKEPVPIVQDAGWAPGPVWTGAEILAPTGTRSPDRPTRSQSLYRLRYPAHKLDYTVPRINRLSYRTIQMRSQITIFKWHMSAHLWNYRPSFFPSYTIEYGFLSYTQPMYDSMSNWYFRFLLCSVQLSICTQVPTHPHRFA